LNGVSLAARAAERDKDTAACEYETKKAEISSRGDMLDRGDSLKEMKELCMKSRGYTESAAAQ
jgi:hypothetical protein